MGPLSVLRFCWLNRVVGWSRGRHWFGIAVACGMGAWLVAGGTVFAQPPASDGPGVASPAKMASVKREVLGPSKHLTPVRESDGYTGHSTKIVAIAMSARGETTLSASADGSLQLWKTASNALLKKLKSPETKLACVAISPDGKLIAAGGSQGLVYIWRADDGALLHRLKGHKHPIASVTLSADSSRAASIDERGEAILWEFASESPLFLTEQSNRSLKMQAIHFSPTGEHVWTLNAQGDLAQWDSATGMLQHRTENAGLSLPMTVSFDGVWLAANTKRGPQVWKRRNPQTWFEPAHYAWPENPPLSLSRLWLNFEDILLSDEGGGKFRYWRCAEKRAAGTFQSSDLGVSVVAVPSLAFLFLAAEDSGAIARWKLPLSCLTADEYPDLPKARAQFLLRSEKFSELDELLARQRQDKPWLDNGEPLLYATYDALYSLPTGVEADAYEALLTKWAEQRPTSISPRVVQAGYFVRKGWKARGTGYAHTVDEQGARTYEQCLRKVLEIAANTDELDEKDVELYRHEMQACLGLGMPRADLDRAFDSARSIDPLYWPIYEVKALYMLPRWHGEPGELAEWAKVSCSQLGADGDEIYARIACYLVPFHRGRFFEQTQLDPQIVRRGLLALQAKYPDSDRIANPGAVMSTWWLDLELARPFFKTLGTTRGRIQYWGTSDQYGRWQMWVDPAIKRGQEEVLFVPHEFNFASSAVSPDGSQLATCNRGPDPGLAVWNTRNWKQEYRFGPLPARFEVVAYHPKLPWLALGGSEGLPDGGNTRPGPGAANPPTSAYLELFELGKEGLTVQRKFDVDGTLTNSVAFSPDGKWLAFSTDENAYVHSLEDEQSGPAFSRPIGQQSAGLAFSPDSQRLALGNGLQVRVLDPGTGKEIAKIPAGFGASGKGRVTFSPDGAALAFVGPEERVEVWDPKSVKQRARLAENHGNIYSIAFSPDGRFLATAGEEMKVQIWDAQTGKLVHTFEGHWNTVATVHFLPDGKRLVSCGNDLTARVWNIEKWTQADSKK